MAKRTLSPLQLAYREFFLATLEEYNVKSPASLNYEEKKNFFTQIKFGWREKKNELKRKTPPKSPPSKKEQYAKLKAPQSTIAIEPRLRVAKTNSKEVSSVKQYIISTPNSEQTDELRINFFPNNFFEQDTPYSYPVVKMPQPDAFLKLPAPSPICRL